MPQVKETYAHELEISLARKRTEKSVNKLIAAFEGRDITTNWTNIVYHGTSDQHLHFDFVSRGLSISGVATVFVDRVEVDIKIPFAALAFKGLIKKAMDKQVNKFLAPGYMKEDAE